MFGCKKCLVSVLLALVVLTVAEGVPVAKDDLAPSPTLNRQKRTFFSSWWPYSGTEIPTSPVQPYYRIIIRGQTNSPVVDDWNNQHSAEIIAELEAAKNRLDETLQKLKNLSKELYNSDESDENNSGERKPRPETVTTTRPPLRPYNIKYVPTKTTPPVVKTNTMPPQVKPLPTTVTPTTTKTDSEAVIFNPATAANSQKVEPATSTQIIDIRFKPDEDVKTSTTSATVEVLPVQPATTTTPAAIEVRPVQPATTTAPVAVEVLPVEPATTTPAAVEVRPVQPATTTPASDNTNEKVEPQQHVTTTETEDVKIQPEEPVTTTTAEDSSNRIRSQTSTSTASDDNADVKTEPQQQATTAAAATIEDSTNAAVENIQPEQPARAEDSSATTEPEALLKSRYASESASLENWKNNKKKISWDYYLKKRAPLNEKMPSKIGAQYARELQADR